jgi:bla regulator protein BlaR1
MKFSHLIINTIGQTLFHSLWQGLVLAVITALIIVLTRSKKPALRYNLLIFMMLAFFVTTIVTFMQVMSSIAHPEMGALVNAHTLDHVASNSATSNINLNLDPTMLDQMISYLNRNNTTLVLIWLLIVLARSLQLMVGLSGLKHLRSKAIFGSAPDWDVKVKDLTKRLGINQAIGLAESALIKVPMVIGHIKPLILLPIGLLTALPPKEIEAILIHELAHIYRRDYLVNILQSLMEILFFFNPAVLWLSALIKAERENCCDDIAVGLTSSKLNYINALVSCQEYKLALPAYAMAFSKKGQLKSRVIRLLHNHNQSLNGMEKSILACCMVMASLSLLAFANSAKIQSTITTVQTKFTTITESSESSKAVAVVKEPTPTTKPAALKIKWKASNHRYAAVQDWRIQDSLIAISRLQKINAQKAQLADLSLKVATDISISIADSVRQQTETVPDTPKLKRIDTKISPISRKITKPQVALSHLIQQELIKDSIVGENDTRSSFMLSRMEMIVNGKMQPPEVYEKYKDKFIPAEGSERWYFYRNYNEGRKTVTTPVN